MSNLDQIKGTSHKIPWWQPEKEITKPVNLHISIPTYNNQISLYLDNSLRQAIATSKLGEKLQTNFSFIGSDSLISRARDKLAANFLNTDAEWQLQIDSDIIFPTGLGPQLAKFYSNWMNPETFNNFMQEGVFRLALSLNAIDEILRSGIKDNQTIVGGLYFWRGGVRNFNETASIIPHDHDFEVQFRLGPDNYIYTDRLATGFLLIHRSVYEDIQAMYPELAYHSPPHIEGKPTYAFYTPCVTDEKAYNQDGSIKQYRYYRSEDYAFSWRAKQAGHTPVINMNLLLGHLGEHIYSWFDRPALQKIMYEHYNHPKHHIRRDEQ